MKPNELRISNVVYDSTGAPNEIVKVYSVAKRGEIASINGIRSTHFQPIPLTEEWLLKFGFEFKPTGEEVYEQTWRLSAFEIWEHDKGFCHDYCTGNNVLYVHELQNLYFALTGEELIIK